MKKKPPKPPKPPAPVAPPPPEQPPAAPEGSKGGADARANAMRLLVEGFTVTAAAEQVGVDRKTVRRWRDSVEGQKALDDARKVRSAQFADAADQARRTLREAAPLAALTAHDTADSIPSPSAAPGEPGEASSQSSQASPALTDSPAPTACPCSLPLPCTSRVYARGVCYTWHKKMGQQGLPIGEDGRNSANASRGLRQLAHRLSSATPATVGDIVQRMKPDARDRLAEALERVGGKGRG